MDFPLPYWTNWRMYVGAHPEGVARPQDIIAQAEAAHVPKEWFPLFGIPSNYFHGK